MDFNKCNGFFFKGKRAFGGVASTLIMFIAIIGVTTGMVMAFQNYFLQTKDVLAYQQEQTSEKLKTFVTITHIVYDEPSDNLRVFVKNTGSVELDATLFDVYVDGNFGSGLTSYYAGTSSEAKVLRPSQTLYVDYGIDLEAGSHKVKVVTELGVSDDEDFNVE